MAAAQSRLSASPPGRLVLAGYAALWLGSKRLKTLDGAWIVLSALYLLWRNA